MRQARPKELFGGRSCPSSMAPHTHANIAHKRMIKVRRRTVIGWTLVLIGLMALPAEAVEYRLQVTNLDYRVFASYQENPPFAWSEQAPMSRLETLLDQRKFPTNAVIPGREVQLLDDMGYGGTIPARIAVLPATRDQAWTTIVWDGNPEDRVAFVVKTDMVAWQEVWSVAASAGGNLRRLSMGGPSLFGRQSRQVPEVSQDFLAHAAASRSFISWVQQHATPIDGMWVVVGRGNNVFYSPDRVYVLIQTAPEPRTYKLVIGWRDHSDRGNGRRFFPLFENF